MCGQTEEAGGVEEPQKEGRDRERERERERASGSLNECTRDW